MLFLGCSLSGASCTSTPAFRRAPTLHEIQGRESKPVVRQVQLNCFFLSFGTPDLSLCSHKLSVVESGKFAQQTRLENHISPGPGVVDTGGDFFP